MPTNKKQFSMVVDMVKKLPEAVYASGFLFEFKISHHFSQIAVF